MKSLKVTFSVGGNGFSRWLTAQAKATWQDSCIAAWFKTCKPFQTCKHEAFGHFYVGFSLPGLGKVSVFKVSMQCVQMCPHLLWKFAVGFVLGPVIRHTTHCISVYYVT